MKRAAALATLLAASVAAGMWLYRPAPRETADSCADGGTCSAEPQAEPVAEPSGAGDEAQSTSDIAPSAAAARPPAAPAPPDAAALRARADELLAAGQVLEAIAALRAATEADPSAKNHGDLGNLLVKTLALDQGLVHLRKAAELDPKNPDRWLTLANAYYRKVDLGKAWDAEKKAKAADPSLVLEFDAGGRRVRKPAPASPGDSPAGKP